MAAIHKGDPEWDRLHETWLAEGKPGFLSLGGSVIQVYTPNGDEEPVFDMQSYETMTSKTSFTVEVSRAPKNVNKDPRKKSK